MRVKHHFFCEYSKALTDALEKNEVPYEHDVWAGTRSDSVSFDLYEDRASFVEIAALAGSDSVQSAEYTKQELLDAEWLTLRCCHPTLELVREEEAFTFSEPFADGKYRHRELVGNTFYLKKPMNWKSRHFVSDGGFGNQILFCDQIARSVLEGVCLPIRFVDVLHYKSGLPLENVFYMDIQDVLPIDAVILNGKEEKRICETCGKIQYQLGSIYQLTVREDSLKTRNGICKTPSIFAWGEYYTEPLNLVSNQVYHMLLDNELSKNLVFEPVRIRKV